MTKPTGRPRGAPPLPPDVKRGVRIEVRATPAELAEIDRRREREAAATATEPDTRSDWLLRAAGVRTVEYHPKGGEHIKDAARRAIARASVTRDVDLVFNNARFQVDARSRVEDVVAAQERASAGGRYDLRRGGIDAPDTEPKEPKP